MDVYILGKCKCFSGRRKYKGRLSEMWMKGNTEKQIPGQAVVAHTLNLSPRKAEAVRSLSSRMEPEFQDRCAVLKACLE